MSLACELLLGELVCDSYNFTKSSSRKTVGPENLIDAVSNCDKFDFLLDIVGDDKKKEQIDNLLVADLSKLDSKAHNLLQSLSKN